MADFKKSCLEMSDEHNHKKFIKLQSIVLSDIYAWTCC